MKVRSIKIEYENGDITEYDTKGELYNKKQIKLILSCVLANMKRKVNK